MRIKTVYVRFYKSFNYDYLRKVHPNAKFDTWDMLEGSPYPYVRVPLEPDVTTIVGANESGKSHLLSAIEKGLTGEGIEREDFCRYSQFFTVEAGKIRWPEFGFEFSDLTDADKQAIVEACGVADPATDRFMLFRTARDTVTVYLPSRDKYSMHPVIAGKEKCLLDQLPRVVHMQSNVALPDSVPLLALINRGSKDASAVGAEIPREKRFEVLDKLAAVAGQDKYYESDKTVQDNAAAIRASMSSILQAAKAANRTLDGTRDAGVVLARKLLFNVAKVDPAAVEDLYNALRDGNDGHANGLMQKINEHLAATLNFPHWWVQDRDFRLVVTPRDHDIVLTIRDRTGTDYSFSERSGGLKYFLSYYVQYRAHSAADDRPEILLMDEPDAHLSSEGQQDLLKIFEAFAHPKDSRRPVQVAYVTHSPFLIDKNHAGRIRVLEKGVSEEGTRVVRDAARNHYEPLRSAFGAYVGETTFIGNCNLVVEGLADQVLLAGAATQIRMEQSAETETLDLNSLTIVPAGSASHVPYLVYLARGRDVEQPAVIVLLDSDAAGDEAVKVLRKGPPRGKQIIRPQLVLQVGSVPGIVAAIDGVAVVEDLVPLGLCLRAARSYACEVCAIEVGDTSAMSEQRVRAAFEKGRGVFEALDKAFSEIPDIEGFHLDKVGFSRFVLSELEKSRRASELGNAAEKELVCAFDSNFKALFARLNALRRDAERETRGDRVSNRVDRAKRAFVLDHPSNATREHAAILMEDIEAVLDSSRESDEIKVEIQRMRRDFKLDAALREPLSDLQGFQARLERLKYSGRIATQEVPLVVPKAEVPSPSGTTQTVETKGSGPQSKPAGGSTAEPLRQ